MRGKADNGVERGGSVRMADVSAKGDTVRVAVAEGRVFLSRTAWTMLRRGQIPKGDVLSVARVAGISAAKETSRILPLCHPLPIDAVRIDLTLPAPGEVRIEAEVKTCAKTGVEMEALTAVAASALCVYDMAKPVDRSIRIEGIRLLRKSGGKSGDYEASRTAESSRRRVSASRAAARASSSRRGTAPKRSR
ncbi:MAG: cyclic pyranopterin monophosphate synthase MoaC [Deltaproteobacteria bacterium]